jgi:NADPH:quinone reductase-like Zn-dependent oxidoreductase
MKLRFKIVNGVLIVVSLAVISLGLVLSHDSACGPAPEISGQAETMKAVVYRCYGSPDVLRLEDVEKPVPADDEVLVRIHAAAINPYDWHFMRGSPYIMRLGSGIGAPKDTRLGVDFAGTVESVGSGVTRFQPGDEVFGGRSGAFAEFVTVRENRAIAHKPDNISFEQAASVGIAGITALQALRDRGQVQTGQKVLINGASGGVGTFAVQIAKALGAEVSGVCSTRNVDMVRALGADHVFDYTRENYTESAQHFDVILDMVGNHSLSANKRVLAPQGKFLIIGAPKGNWFRPLLAPVKALMYSPFVSQEFSMFISQFRQEDLNYLGELMRSGKVTPVIDRSYSLSEVPAAIQYSEEGHARGKIVVSVN